MKNHSWKIGGTRKSTIYGQNINMIEQLYHFSNSRFMRQTVYIMYIVMGISLVQPTTKKFDDDIILL